MSDNCYLPKEPFFQCCCNCESHKEDHSHPSIDGERVTNVKGYICIADGTHFTSGWPLHSVGCEMYIPKATPPHDVLEKMAEHYGKSVSFIASKHPTAEAGR